MLCCPMTSHKKGYPFEVVINDDLRRTSVVLADQVKSLDWKTRQAVKKGAAPPHAIMETLGKLQTLLSPAAAVVRRLTVKTVAVPIFCLFPPHRYLRM